MELTSLIIFLLIGAVAGWLAGQIMKGGGFGLVGDIIVGVIGSVIGGWLFGVLGIGIGGLIGSIIAAVVGAIILIAIIRAIKRAQRTSHDLVSPERRGDAAPAGSSGDSQPTLSLGSGATVHVGRSLSRPGTALAPNAGSHSATRLFADFRHSSLLVSRGPRMPPAYRSLDQDASSRRGEVAPRCRCPPLAR